MNNKKVWLNIRDSFWFMPAVYGVVALIASILIVLADIWLESVLNADLLKQVLTSNDTTVKLYSTLVTAILTMTTLSFSVIMVVLTTYSTQFSPRILQNFMKSRFTQHVLGIYCTGFILALVLLLFNDYSKPIIGPFVMVIIAIINLGAFVFFIHHSARFLQVNNLINMLEKEASKVIDQLYRKEKPYKIYRAWDETELKNLNENKKVVVKAKQSGYIQSIQWEDIINWAAKNNSVVEFHVEPGSFIPLGIPVMTIWTNQEVKAKLNPFIIIGNERADIQDFEFTIQKIEEIALRAIAPSQNDPHTAINCINRIGILLSELGEVYEHTPYLADKKDNLRVIHKPMSYDDYLYRSFYELRHYGKNDLAIIYGILDVLYKIAVVSNDDIKEKMWQFHYYIMEVVHWEELSKLDKEHLQEVYDRLEISCTTKE